MKPKHTILLIPILILCQSANAALQNTLEVTGVNVSKMNTASDKAAGYHTCKTFKGTIQNNTVWLKPRASHGSGNYKHTLVWRLGSGYEGYNGFEEQFEQNVGDGNSYGINIPTLRDEIPFVQQAVLLITTDLNTGETSSTQKLFTVSREVVLNPSDSLDQIKENCFQRYAAFPSTTGVLSDGSTNPSQLSIKQGIQKLWENTSGSSWGFFIAPLSWISFGGFSLGNLVSFNKNYFTNLSKQTAETVDVTSGYLLSPGDFIQIYTQKTRYVTNYDATTVDACGGTQTLPGAYKLQWWGFAYHAVPINPFDATPPVIDNVGAKPMNTCPKELDSGFGKGGDNEFYQTNI